MKKKQQKATPKKAAKKAKPEKGFKTTDMYSTEDLRQMRIDWGKREMAKAARTRTIIADLKKELNDESYFRRRAEDKYNMLVDAIKKQIKGF